MDNSKSKKEGVSRTYKGFDGYAPMMAYIGTEGYAINFERLLDGGTITKTIRHELTYKEIDDSIENIWSVLLATGYLTQRGRVSGGQMKRADRTRLERFCKAFPEGNVSEIQDMLRDYLWNSISVRDTAVRRSMKEKFYHGLLLELLQSQSGWLIRSNAELGEGYGDISVCTPDRTGIIIELKYVEKVIRYGIAFRGKECLVAGGLGS